MQKSEKTIDFLLGLCYNDHNCVYANWHISVYQQDSPLHALHECPKYKEGHKMDAIQAFVSEQLKTEIPAFGIGDGVKVYIRITEGEKTRTQMFEGTVIARHGGGISETFTVRRVSYGVGVEKTFPIHSPNIEKIVVFREAKVRRAKLYYLRSRVGKAAKVKEKV